MIVAASLCRGVRLWRPLSVQILTNNRESKISNQKFVILFKNKDDEFRTGAADKTDRRKELDLTTYLVRRT